VVGDVVPGAFVAGASVGGFVIGASVAGASVAGASVAGAPVSCEGAVVPELVQMQCVAGQFDGQFRTHQLSMLAFPAHAPAALQEVVSPPPAGASVSTSVAATVGDAVVATVGDFVLVAAAVGELVTCAVGEAVVSSVGASVLSEVVQVQCVAGQLLGQFRTHQLSILASPAHAPAALQVVCSPPVAGTSVAAAVGETVTSSSVLVGGSVEGLVSPVPSAVMAKSAQFQNASGYE